MGPLIIVGASVRAAAGSARRAGYAPWCADRYRDLDTQAMSWDGRAHQIQKYSELLEVFKSSPDAPWVYTGPLENEPNLIADLAAIRPLWGNSRNALIACRSPLTVDRVLRDAGVPTLEARSEGAEIPDDGEWLSKPLKSCGGHGICHRRRDVSANPDEGRYYQEFAHGTPMSAVFASVRKTVRLLGVTEQLSDICGVEWLNAPPFYYAGSIGPVPYEPGLWSRLQRIGEALTTSCFLRGLFGVDFILRDQIPYVVEVNPRYTASIEVLERGLGLRSFCHQREEFAPDSSRTEIATGQVQWVGKAVVYANIDARLNYDNAFLHDVILAEQRAATHYQPENYADLPPQGSQAVRGRPIMTVLAEALTRDECLSELQRRAGRVRSQIRPPNPPGGGGIDRTKPLDDQ